MAGANLYLQVLVGESDEAGYLAFQTGSQCAQPIRHLSLAPGHHVVWLILPLRCNTA